MTSKKTVFPILDLPSELLAEVFAFFSTEEILSTLSQVCQRFSDVCKITNSLDLTIGVIKTIHSFDEFFKHYNGVQSLKLKIRQGVPVENIFNAIEDHCANLKSIEIFVGPDERPGFYCQESFTKDIAWMPTFSDDPNGFVNTMITSFMAPNVSLSDEIKDDVIKVIKTFTNLKRLGINLEGQDDWELADFWSAMPTVEEVHLELAYPFHLDELFEAKADTLQKLTYRQTIDYSPEDPNYTLLQKCSRLTHLTLVHTMVNINRPEDGLHDVFKSPTITHLFIDHQGMKYLNIYTDWRLPPQLESFSVGDIIPYGETVELFENAKKVG